VKFLERRKKSSFEIQVFQKFHCGGGLKEGKDVKEVRVYLSVFLVEFLRMADRHHLVKGLGAWLN